MVYMLSTHNILAYEENYKQKFNANVLRQLRAKLLELIPDKITKLSFYQILKNS